LNAPAASWLPRGDVAVFTASRDSRRKSAMTVIAVPPNDAMASRPPTHDGSVTANSGRELGLQDGSPTRRRAAIEADFLQQDSSRAADDGAMLATRRWVRIPRIRCVRGCGLPRRRYVGSGDDDHGWKGRNEMQTIKNDPWSSRVAGAGLRCPGLTLPRSTPTTSREAGRVEEVIAVGDGASHGTNGRAAARGCQAVRLDENLYGRIPARADIC
jgi:hypothetical protein